MTHFLRSEWGARAARGGPGALDRREVIGVALHWPAMSKPLRTVPEVMSALRAWQDYHMDTHGWSDIAYQVAFDQAGNTYRLRGMRTQSGANGDGPVNEAYGAFLLILAPGEQPSEAMLHAVRRRIRAHRRIFPNSNRVRGHNEVRPEATACPGAIVQGLLRRGVFNPDVPLAELWSPPVPAGRKK